MSAVATAIIARMMRSSMLEVIRQDYMMTARAKGLRESTAITRHALRNALLPVTTVVGLQLGFMLTGSVLTETVFNWPGLGLEIKRAIEARDIPMIQGFILFLTLVFVTVNLLVDIAYAYMDPRIRYE
jgi:ABC-type dipeptide/oligopeptide/nickel transport system permease component